MRNMNKQQKMFYDGQRVLKALKKVEACRPLTPKEEAMRKETLDMLYQEIICFGLYEANKRCKKYKISQDAYHEMQQSMAVIFLEKLPDYDPTLSTPTTYFVRYFDQVISEYLHAESQHLSQYDANNVSLVRRAKHFFEAQNIRWDEQMISTRTGLSPKVVKRTLALEANSIYANVDETFNLQSHEPTPEEQYIKNERHDAMFGAVRAELSDLEYKFFMFKMNNCEDTAMTYQQTADMFGLTPKEAKKFFNHITSKLANNAVLQSYRSNRSHGEATVTIHRAPQPIEDDCIFEALSGPGISFAPENDDDEE